MAKPIAIDLFSGCGGLTLGLQQAGFKVLGAVEIDSLSVETYKANHQDVQVWKKDIQDLSVSDIQKVLNLKKGELDLLAGCPPCQGFSSLRTLNGSKNITDIRNDLIFDFLRFIEELMPKAIMMENVPGLAQDERFTEFCKCLKKLGYDPKYHVLNAADYGVPQRRRRLILLASRFGAIDFADKVTKKTTVRDAIGSLPPVGNSGDNIHDLTENRTQRILDLIKKIPKNGGSRKDLPFDEQLECHKKCDGFKDVYGRMAWDKIAPTITSGCFNPSKGRFLHPEENRAITMREAALLQGFPLSYKFPKVTSKSSIALMIGNALPPEFIKRHATEINKHLTGSSLV